MKAALLSAALVPLLAIAAPAHAALFAHGFGKVTFPSCASTPDDITVAGHEQGSSWTLVLIDTNKEGPCELAEANVFQGRWNPAIGGCLKSVRVAAALAQVTDGSLCLKHPHKIRTGLYEYDVWGCLPLAGCVTGEITMTFTNVAP